VDVKQRLEQKNIAQPLALASAGAIWKDPLGLSRRPAHREIRAAGQAGALDEDIRILRE
jgi:hypothetical protein